MSEPFIAKFSHAEDGMTRFPPHVEQLMGAHESMCIQLVARWTDVELRFPLDCDPSAGSGPIEQVN
jgi:hypothetical protein